MTTWRSRLFWLAVGAAVAGAVFWMFGGGGRFDLVRAVERGEVDYVMQAGEAPAPEGSWQTGGAPAARVTVLRGANARGRLFLTLGAGTLIGAPGGQSQRLMTAAPVTFDIAADQAQVDGTVETYCLEPFKPPPTIGTGLAFVEAGGDPAEEEARKLVGCLKGEGSHNERQLVVWLVSQGYLAKSYGEVRESLFENLRRELAAEVQAKIDEGLAEHLRRVAPGASEEMIERQRARFTPDVVAARVGREAQQNADDFLKGFVAAGARLQACGYDTASLEFFRSAPASAD